LPTERTRRRLVVSAVCAAVSAGLALLPLATASCSRLRQSPRADEAQAVERLRALAHQDALRMPAESAVNAIETGHAGSRAGSLARLLRARVKLAAGDAAGAASLLDDKSFRQHTSIADYALLLRGEALAKANRATDARAAYEQLARDFPDSPRARDALLRSAELALRNNDAAPVPALLKRLADADDGDALLLTARAHERQGDAARARETFRRAYFSAPGTNAAAEAAKALVGDAAATSRASAEEARARANRLYDAKLYAVAADAYSLALARFPNAADARSRLRHGVAAFNAKRYAEAVTALSAVPSGAGDLRAEALFHLAQSQARLRQFDAARATVAELRRAFPDSAFARRAGAAVGFVAKELKNTAEATNFFRAAVAAHPGAVEVAQAQFELAWAAHEARNFAESARLLVEHLATYADRSTDNRGRAGYWAARDSERAGRTTDARTLYEAMLQRYDANWYGHLARQRLDALTRAGVAPAAPSPAESDALVAREMQIAQAAKNLGTVTVAEETAGPESDATIRRADELSAVGLDEWALEELERLLTQAPNSPRLNLAKAKVLRAADRNVEALIALQKSFPDYAQMKPEEMTREQWDVFYPLEHWETILSEARARSLDPARVAAFIRQESVFNPRAESHANAYGLMQLIMETARRTAARVGAPSISSKEQLFEPRLNIKLGTAYLREQLDKYGRVEYAAAAYNAGPGRADRWKVELPSEIDEWTEAVPFRETRQYVQGIIRNTLQYQRLYDSSGQFRPEVGARPLRPPTAATTAPAGNGDQVRPRRAPEGEEAGGDG
jgi:soluble lytic murein transglycosylase